MVSDSRKRLQLVSISFEVKLVWTNITKSRSIDFSYCSESVEQSKTSEGWECVFKCAQNWCGVILPGQVVTTQGLFYFIFIMKFIVLLKKLFLAKIAFCTKAVNAFWLQESCISLSLKSTLVNMVKSKKIFTLQQWTKTSTISVLTI